MPTYRDEAVVLRTHKLGEADRIVTLLTKQHGRVRAVAKGVRRTSSKFGARLEPFMVVDAQFYIGRNLDIVQQADSLGSYGADIVADYERYTAASAMVEAADRVNEAESTSQQFFLLVGALRSLSRGEHAPQAIMDSYLLRAMALSGWALSFEDCARCGAPGPHDRFVGQLGGVVCEACAPAGSPRIGRSGLSLLAALLQGDWERVDATPSRDLSAASGLVAAYAQFHLERAIRSFSHVEKHR
ncbi:DNA repair protein RecO [Microbacterium oryzae]|uniref:DNA repair protein RecO n=1 Tax=Microbacterium oryzae TaxID=743009 RepID=UPI0025B0B860|nr:DNA repair protein RecO [Microbacterium oryzae]MDN3311722.1 DNA repair protein RecO [Microbacterium oryzae]